MKTLGRLRRAHLGLFAISAVGCALVLSPSTAAATPPSLTSAQSYAVVQGLTAPLGDVTITEQSAGQLTAGDIITYRFTDSTGGSTIHLTSAPAVGGTHGLSAAAQIASSSGTLNDEVQVTIETAYSETVTLPFFNHTFAFHPTSTQPL